MNFLVDLSSLALSLVIVGFLTETVVELLKTYVIKTKFGGVAIYTISIIVGILLCFALEISIFDKDRLLAYYIGIVICGLVASRGSNYVHNWMDKLPRTLSK